MLGETGAGRRFRADRFFDHGFRGQNKNGLIAVGEVENAELNVVKFRLCFLRGYGFALGSGSGRPRFAVDDAKCSGALTDFRGRERQHFLAKILLLLWRSIVAVGSRVRTVCIGNGRQELYSPSLRWS